MRVGFIGLGNVGGKLAGSLLRNGFNLVVRDLDPTAALPLLEAGATQMSAQSVTVPGGYEKHQEEGGQFDIADHRTVAELDLAVLLRIQCRVIGRMRDVDHDRDIRCELEAARPSPSTR